MNKIVTLKLFKKAFFSTFRTDKKINDQLHKLNLVYVENSSKKNSELNDFKKKINTGYFWISGKKQINKWDNGWSYNLTNLKNKKKIFPAIIPYYYKKKSKLVICGKIIEPITQLFEFKIFGIYRDFIFRNYLSEFKNIYELGCGPLHNLVILKKKFKKKNIYGFDWSITSVKISKLLKKYFKLILDVKTVNFFEENTFEKIKENSAAISIGGLEQLGKNFRPIVNHLINSDIKLVINIESFIELYNKDNLLEKLFLKYDKKRNYLNGYIDYLKNLEKEKRIKILKINKVKFGTLGHYSYSTIIWKPIK